MIIFLIILYNFFIVNESKSWEPDEIKNPFTHPEFCQVLSNELSVICDPEKQLPVPLKTTLGSYLLNIIPQNTPCFCDDGCNSFDYTKRLLIGIVIISSINQKSMNCSKHSNIYNCFSERVLHNWNISQCSGNNGLILVTKKQIHLYFGKSARKKIQNTCLVRLESQIRPIIPLSYNLRVIFKHTLEYIRKPCMCNDSCTYRHLKWLTNVVFFMGVIVLVTCIGGMSRRALVAKFYDRPFPRNNALCNNFSRPPLLTRPAVTPHVIDILQTSGNEDPPDYSTLGPISKPPPYIQNPNSNYKMNISHEHTNSDLRLGNQIPDQPPAYSIINNELMNSTTSSHRNPNETHYNNNSVL